MANQRKEHDVKSTFCGQSKAHMQLPNSH